MMTNGFAVAVCLLGAIGNFVLAAKLKRFRVSEKAPASRAMLTREERQRKITIARRIALATGCIMSFGAVLLGLI
jgi:hypothetical protein